MIAQGLDDDLFVMHTLEEPGDSHGGTTSDEGLVLDPPSSSLLASADFDFDAGLNMCDSSTNLLQLAWDSKP